jgi:putative FmdB family regulatory protein
MAIYAYKCPVCGPFDLHLPMGDADGSRPCPSCTREARRLISAPFLARTPAPMAAQLHREEASRDAPEVVNAVPPAARRRATPPTNPKWASLPRP